MHAIEVKNLTRLYEYYRKEQGLVATLRAFVRRKTLYAEAVKNVSFFIDEGELVGFLGPNGAGKTTTLKMLSGVLTPTRGEVRVLGYTPSRREKEYQKQFALVMGQKAQLIKDLPAIETFILNKEIYEVSDDDFKEHLAELIDIFVAQDFLDIPVRKLSLGQRMKCELIAALIHKPKVLFLDEPTIGLDVIAQKNIRDFIKRYNDAEKTTIILTSHYMEDIRELCRRVIIINSGQIIYDGSFDDLIKKYAPHKLLKVTFSGEGIDLADAQKFGEVGNFTPHACIIKIGRSKVRESATALLSSNLPVDDILIDEMEIDDVVRQIFKK